MDINLNALGYQADYYPVYGQYRVVAVDGCNNPIKGTERWMSHTQWDTFCDECMAKARVNAANEEAIKTMAEASTLGYGSWEW